MMIFQNAGVRPLGFVFPIMINEVIARDSDDPGFQGARFGPVGMECPIHLQENLLSQILSFVKASCETVGQIVDSRVPPPNDDFPGLAVSAPALFYQFGVGRIQRSSSAFTIG
jgi:hypothetical protein